jgi:hypothetical protein
VAERDHVPLAGVVDDAVRIDRAALGLRARRRRVVDLDPLVLARGGDQLAQVARDRGVGLGDDRAGGQALGLAGVAAERGEQLVLRRQHRRVERRDPALAQRAQAEQQGRALGRRQPQRPGQAVREVHEHAALVDRDQQVLAGVAVGRADLR